jgi:pyruvate kinase
LTISHNHRHASPGAAQTTLAYTADVANIILDGADGVLLGAETLRGK